MKKSTLFCLLLLGIGLFLVYYIRMKSAPPPSPVAYIASRSKTALSLPFDVLQHLLSLSDEEKENMVKADVSGIEGRLQQCPAIASASVRRLFPDTLVVDYALRVPLFQLGCWPNLVVDEQGTVFRKSPYFPSVTLPILYFPDAIRNHTSTFSSCVYIYTTLRAMGLLAAAIDARDSLQRGIFRREISVRISFDETRTLWLRLPVENTERVLERLSLILERFPEYSGTIDLRFPDTAYLE